MFEKMPLIILLDLLLGNFESTLLEQANYYVEMRLSRRCQPVMLRSFIIFFNSTISIFKPVSGL